MITRKCCCTNGGCCEDYLVDQFVTLFDKEMDSAVPVSQDDLITLKINRPGALNKSKEYAFSTNGNGHLSCPRCCSACTIQGCECGPFVPEISTNWDIGSEYYGANKCIPCCCVTDSKTASWGCADTNPACQDGTPLRTFVGSSLPNVPSIFKKITNKIIKEPKSFFDKYKAISLSQIEKQSKSILLTQEKNEKQTKIFEKKNRKNEQFKTSLEYTSLCKSCLEKNKIDINCIYNNSPECASAATQMCEQCGEECNRYCDPVYGGTETQIDNVSTLLNNVNYQNKLVPLAAEQDTASVYLGETKVESFAMPPDGGNGGNPGGGGNLPEQELCKVCLFTSGTAPAPPIYFIYRYSYCNFVWYPPEWIFDYNPAPSQGASFFNNGLAKSCDYMYGRVNSDIGGGANTHVSCLVNKFDQPQFCGKDAGAYPCQCKSFPHLSGGLVDTVRRNYNFSQKEFFGGFIPSKNPFLPQMKVSEIGCCFCFTSSWTRGPNECDTAGGFDQMRSQYTAYPYASGYGRGYQIYGTNCVVSGGGKEFYNPQYKLYCFNRGMSPYLSRIAQQRYVPAFDIMYYGSAIPESQETLGAYYQSAQILDNGTEWTKLRFTKLYNKKSSLYQKLVGIISLEHHFESWAYHSKAAFSTSPPLLMNHCNVLLTPYERPYAGTVNECSFQWDPRAAMRWQIQRSLPRNVIYGSSGVPIFFSDLYAFEELSKRKGILIAGEEFDGGKFLEKFYLYFFNGLGNKGTSGEPLIEPSTVDDYNYVTDCIKAMIKNNIISIKDHADDIRTELIEALDEIFFEPSDTEEQFPIFDTLFVETQIGGRSGYLYLIKFIKTLAGLDPTKFLPLSQIKELITVTLIKKLINPRSNKRGVPAQMFWGPRRVKLVPTPESSGLTAWGCTQNGCSSSNPSPLNVPNIPNEQYINVFSGDRTSFSITTTGKVLITGNEADLQPWPNNRGTDADNNNFNSSIAAIPDHLGIVQDLEPIPADRKDGRVIKVSSKSNFAVALVSYDNEIPIGTHLGKDGSNASVSDLLLDSNSGIQDETSFDRVYHDSYSGFNTTNPNPDYFGEGISGYRLKAWGPDVNIGIFRSDNELSYFYPTSLFDISFNFPLKNRYKIWKDVAAGVKHCSAITADGFLFDSIASDDSIAKFKGPSYSTSSGDSLINYYYKNLPKPDYFSQQEWNDLISWRAIHCNCPNSTIKPVVDIRCRLFKVATNDEQNPYPYYNNLEPDRPTFTDVGAGHYHTIAVSSDQNIITYGKYYKVKPDGSILGPTETDQTGNTGIEGIGAFTPSSILSPDRWTIGGLTYCAGITLYTTATKTNASVQVFDVDGGPDYSMAILGGPGSPSTVAVWGHSEMVSALNGNEYAGLTAIATKSYDRIDRISAGANSFAVLYRRNNSSRKLMDIFVRPSKKEDSTYDCGLTEFPISAYQDVAMGYGHGIGIVEQGYKANVWNGRSFNTYTGHDTLQFAGFSDLPLYFRSQAFFRCLPGHWDMSKWLFGRTCNQVGSVNPQNVILQPDKCSIYWRKNEKNLCYTGFPQYYWMKTAWRRYCKVTPLHSRDPGGDGCGLLRDADGLDHLDPENWNGTGPADEGIIDYGNRQLNTLIGGCYSGAGDICWMGDGSPSSFAYQTGYVDGSGKRCICQDPCGCEPPLSIQSATAYEYKCRDDIQYVAPDCFGYVIGRAGFSSNKDYFVQSHKTFGSINQLCCGVVNTNITSFYYAKRCYYYRYNKDTDLYEVNNAPLKYRTYYAGDKRDEPNPGATSATFINYTMTPEDAIPKTYQVDWVMPYPLVYCGGDKLRKIKINIALSTGLRDCNCAFTCTAEEACRGTCACNTGGGDVCRIPNPGAVLLGPGGWLYNPSATCTTDGGQIKTVGSDGLLEDSIYHQDEVLYLKAGSADGGLGPLVEFGPYTGRLPPGFSAACYTGPNCPCPNYDAHCNGCDLQCTMESVYDIVREYTLDDLDLYVPADAKPTYDEDSKNKLYRVYEEIPSRYNLPGFNGATGDPLCFIGGVTDVPNGGCDPDTSSAGTDFFRAYVYQGQPYLVAGDFNCGLFTG